VGPHHQLSGFGVWEVVVWRERRVRRMKVCLRDIVTVRVGFGFCVLCRHADNNINIMWPARAG